MTQRSIPWDGTTLDDAGPYGAADWQELYRMLLGNQVSPSTRGPLFTSEFDSLVVTEKSGTPDMSVEVGKGAALVDGVVYWSDATENLAITAADPTLNRIDRVILRLDETNGRVRLAVKAGTPGASPSPPALQTNRAPYFEIPLYQVYVGASVTQILTANLTDERDWANWLANDAIVFNDQTSTIAPSAVDTWEDIDTTNLAIDLRTTGRPVEVWGGILLYGCSAIHVDFSYDGNRFNDTQYSDATGLVAKTIPGGGGVDTLVFGPVRLALAAGDHTFEMMWLEQDSGGGTPVAYLAGTAWMGVREVQD